MSRSTATDRTLPVFVINSFIRSTVCHGPTLDQTSSPASRLPLTTKILNLSRANKASLFLAWNYSVTSGFDTSNAQALAIDNVSILGLNGGATNPSGVGAANPSSVAALNSTLLTVTVTPGTNPPSTAHTVAVDLSAIGGSASQQFF